MLTFADGRDWQLGFGLEAFFDLVNDKYVGTN
jgi:hypothetical protein